MREIGGQIVGNPVGEIVLLVVAAQVLERQNDDRKPRRVGELVVNGSGHETRREARAPSVAARRNNSESERRGERAQRGDSPLAFDAGAEVAAPCGSRGNAGTSAVAVAIADGVTA